MSNSVFERYTENAKHAIWHAAWEAGAHKSRLIEPEHLLAGALCERSIGDDPLRLSPLSAELLKSIEKGWRPHLPEKDNAFRANLRRGKLRFNDSSKRVLAYAVLISESRKPDRSVGTDDLVLAIMRERSGKAASLLAEHLPEITELQEHIDLISNIEEPDRVEDRRVVIILSFVLIGFTVALLLLAVLSRHELR